MNTPPMFVVTDIDRSPATEVGWRRAPATLAIAERMRWEAAERTRLRTLRQRRKPKGGKARG